MRHKFQTGDAVIQSSAESRPRLQGQSATARRMVLYNIVSGREREFRAAREGAGLEAGCDDLLEEWQLGQQAQAFIQVARFPAVVRTRNGEPYSWAPPEEGSASMLAGSGLGHPTTWTDVDRASRTVWGSRAYSLYDSVRWADTAPNLIQASVYRPSTEVVMAKKRCQITFKDGLWQVSFEGVLPWSARAFRTEAQAHMAVTEWIGLQKAKGHEVEVALLPDATSSAPQGPMAEPGSCRS
jgi:hypothetical protein